MGEREDEGETRPARSLSPHPCARSGRPTARACRRAVGIAFLPLSRPDRRRRRCPIARGCVREAFAHALGEVVWEGGDRGGRQPGRPAGWPAADGSGRPFPTPLSSPARLSNITPPAHPFFSAKSTRTSEYLLVMHEPRASMTGADVKFSDAMSSMPFLLFLDGEARVSEEKKRRGPQTHCRARKHKPPPGPAGRPTPPSHHPGAGLTGLPCGLHRRQGRSGRACPPTRDGGGGWRGCPFDSRARCFFSLDTTHHCRAFSSSRMP
jgi:hypothetical protein